MALAANQLRLRPHLENGRMKTLRIAFAAWRVGLGRLLRARLLPAVGEERYSGGGGGRGRGDDARVVDAPAEFLASNGERFGLATARLAGGGETEGEGAAGSSLAASAAAAGGAISTLLASDCVGTGTVDGGAVAASAASDAVHGRVSATAATAATAASVVSSSCGGPATLRADQVFQRGEGVYAASGDGAAWEMLEKGVEDQDGEAEDGVTCESVTPMVLLPSAFFVSVGAGAGAAAGASASAGEPGSRVSMASLAGNAPGRVDAVHFAEPDGGPEAGQGGERREGGGGGSG